MRNALIALHVSVLLAGTTGVFGKLISLSPMMIVWWRGLIAGGLLAAFVILGRRLERCSRREIARYVLLGALLAYQWMLFYAAIKFSNLSIGVVSFSTVGFFTAIMEPLRAGRGISPREIGFSLLTVAGIALIFHFDSRFRLGLFLGTLSAAAGAFIAILMKEYRAERGPLTVLAYEFVGAFAGATAILPLVFLLAPDTAFFPPLFPDTPYILVFSTVVTLGMYGLQMACLGKVSAFTMNLTYNLEPVYSIAIAVLFLGEARELNGSFWAGIALIAASVVLQTLSVATAEKSAPGRGDAASGAAVRDRVG